MNNFVKNIYFEKSEWSLIFDQEKSSLRKCPDSGNLIKKRLTDECKSDGCVFALNTRKLKKQKVTMYLTCAHNECRKYALRLTLNDTFLPTYVNDKFTMQLFSSNDPLKHEDGQL